MYTIVLVLTIIMPGETPDYAFRVEVANLAQCWDAAQKFVEATDPKQFDGIGVAAHCAKLPKEGARES